MFKRTKGYFLLTLLVLTGLAGRLHSDSLTGKERRFLTENLKESREEFLSSFRGLNETQLNFKPAPEKWSVGECIRHLALSEKGLRAMADQAIKQSANPDKRKEIKVTDEQLLKMVADRQQKGQAPEMLQPTQAQWATTGEAVEDFRKNRASLIKFAKTTTADLRNHVVDFPMGSMDSYQVLLLISAHTRRHTDQIREVVRHPDFPTK